MRALPLLVAALATEEVVALLYPGKILWSLGAWAPNRTLCLPRERFSQSIALYGRVPDARDGSHWRLWSLESIAAEAAALPPTLRRTPQDAAFADPRAWLARPDDGTSVWRTDQRVRLASVGLATEVSPTAADPAVGILFDVWHGFAVAAVNNITARGGTVRTVEDVLESNGALPMSSILDAYGLRSYADNFFFHDKPQAGFYCFYRKDPDEPSGVIPDCANISANAALEAQLLVQSGVDYVVLDSTNLGNPTTESLVIQTRPTEVLFQEWAALRAAGSPTPAITVWQTCAPGTTLFQNQLDLYNQYPDLVYKNPSTGHLVFFVPDTTVDPTILAAVRSNGGRNNVDVVLMWALFGPSTFAEGVWAFMAPCWEDNALSTSVAGDGIAPCGQLMTTNSPLGTAMAVSPSFQVAYSSLPFQGAGKFNAMTFKRQFATALAANPANLLLATWNEFIGQPQANPFNSNFTFDMGLPNDGERFQLWVDTFGGWISRDIEPSAARGSLHYDVMSSCLRVSRLRAALVAALGDASRSLAACPVANEVCCTLDPTQDVWNNVWPFALNSGQDWLLTADPNEHAVLQKSGAWTELCNPYNGPTDFCVDSLVQTSPLALRGPFVIAAGAAAGTPLYRCYDNVHHFFSIDANCEGLGHQEAVLGVLARTRSSNTPRGLTRCQGPAFFYHVLDGVCDPGDASTGVLGFVH